MFALVSGSPKALRMASDHASSFAPRGVWYSAVGVGTRSGLAEACGLAEECGLAEACGLDGAVVGTGLWRTRGFAVGEATAGGIRVGVGEVEASGLNLTEG